MKFKQVDSSLVGSLAASYLTEPVHLRLGDHQETIWFMFAPNMAEEVILGLPWLAKWSPKIHWEKPTK